MIRAVHGGGSGRCGAGAVVLGLAVLAGCASGGGPMPAYQTDVRTVTAVEASTEASAAPTERLPDLPVDQGGAEATAGPRLEAFTATGQDLQIVLRTLAEGFGLGTRIDPAVRGPVYASLEDATLEQALRTILPGEYEYAIQDGVLRVGPARIQSEIFTLDYIALARVGTGTTAVQRQLAGGVGGSRGAVGSVGATGVAGGFGAPGVAGADVISNVQAFNLWEEIRVALEGLIFESASPAAEAPAPSGLVPGARAPSAFTRTEEDGRKLILNPIAGTILVAAPPSNMADIRAYLSAFRASVQRQVQIEAKIVEVSLDREFEFGIDWSLVARIDDVELSTPGQAQTSGGLALTLGPTGGREITAVLNALDTQGDVRVLSSPRTAAMNNQRALFKVTRQEVFFTVTQQPVYGRDGAVLSLQPEIRPEPIEVGIVLDVMPQVGPDNTINMNIRPLIKSLVDVREIRLPDGSSATAPVTEDRTVDTVVRVRSGETIVIGGLMQNRIETRRTGVPVLKDIPLLGRLFGTTREVERKQELVIFITPTIVAGQAGVGG